MVRAQKGLHQRISSIFPLESRTIWFHVSSLGEFEQGRSVIESWKEERPDDFILLTFFSPSGYEAKKNYPFADYVDYLPFDSAFRLKSIIRLINPSVFILVKYDFWPRLLASLYHTEVPVYLISGLFRPEQFFFKWYGRYFLKQIGRMKRIFVQDEDSAQLLIGNGISQVDVTGDTRIDRVFSLAEKNEEIEGIESFVSDYKVIIGGSTWEPEEKLLSQYYKEHLEKENHPELRLIIAPHSIDEDRLKFVESIFQNQTVRLSDWRANPGFYRAQKVLLIDSIGLLSRLYRYADIAIIGGGFSKSIHNILEPASFGLPTLIGPNFHKFPEAKIMLETGGIFSFKNYSEISRILGELLINQSSFCKAGAASRVFIKNRSGATILITSHLLENT